jgi:hypothetical protein
MTSGIGSEVAWAVFSTGGRARDTGGSSGLRRTVPAGVAGGRGGGEAICADAKPRLLAVSPASDHFADHFVLRIVEDFIVKT